VASILSVAGVAPPLERPVPVAPARSALRDAVRRIFYTEPALRLLGHMLLVVAVKT
jgi:hypothetical protein